MLDAVDSLRERHGKDRWPVHGRRERKYRSSRFNGLCEKAFLIAWLPLFIVWDALLGTAWWFPFAMTIGDDEDGRMPLDNAVWGMTENPLGISWDRSSTPAREKNRAVHWNIRAHTSNAQLRSRRLTMWERWTNLQCNGPARIFD